MASLKDIRKRIVSVKNTQKVTKAMKLVAAAKLRRAQRAVGAHRPYADAGIQMVGRVCRRAGSAVPVLMQVRPVKKLDVVVLTSDRGLCGGFNENLLREVYAFTQPQLDEGHQVTGIVLGRKGREGFARGKRLSVLEMTDPLPEEKPLALASKLMRLLEERFLSQASDAAVVAYNRFYSAGRQQIVFEPLLPLARDNDGKKNSLDYLYEPDRETTFQQVASEVLLHQCFQMLLDSRASELAARMRAMDNATKNASDMIGILTLQYNRARQASITADLMDIVGGAEALR